MPRQASCTNLRRNKDKLACYISKSVKAAGNMGITPTAPLYSVPQLPRCIRVIQHDNRASNARAAKEHLDILIAVSGHDTNTVAMPQAHVQHRGGKDLASVCQLAIG